MTTSLDLTVVSSVSAESDHLMFLYKTEELHYVDSAR